MSGRLIGVGAGPGDPELMTLKAARILGEADVVAHYAKSGRVGNARRTAERFLKPGVIELPLLYPVTTEIPASDPAYRAAITAFHDQTAEMVEVHLREGRMVAVLSEGDPFFYGSYMHLHARLAPRYQAEAIPGVCAMSGAWSQAGLPFVQGDDALSVLPGTMAEEELARRLGGCDAAVIMKVGRNLGKIRRALAASGKLADAVYVERATMEGGRTMPLAEKTDDLAPYFSVVLAPGWRARP